MVDRLLRSVGGYWTPTRAGTFRVGRIDAPTGASPVLKVQPWMILDQGQGIERVVGDGPGGAIPTARVLLAYDFNPTVQNQPDLGGDPTSATDPVGGLAQRAWLAQASRTMAYPVAGPDPAVLAKHALAPQLMNSDGTGIETCLVNAADVLDEATRLFNLLSVRRDFLQIRLPSTLVGNADLGQEIWLQAPRFDWGVGKPFVITGMIEQYASNVTVLEVFG